MKRVILAGLILLWAGIPLSAETVKRNKKSFNRFSGIIEGASIYMNVSNQLIGLEDNEKIFNIEQEADSVDVLTGPIMFDVSYAFSEDFEIYLGTPFFDDDREGLTFGMSKLFKDSSRLDVSVFAGGESVWEDPFLTGRDRKETQMYWAGIGVDYEEIMGSGLSIYAKVKGVETDDDEIGKKNPALKRSGGISNVGARYRLDLSDAHSITPGVCFIRGEMDGESESYSGGYAELYYEIENEKYSLFMAVSGGKFEFDEMHPIYEKTRKDENFYGGAILTVYDLWSNPRIYCRWGVGIHYNDSNIDFFDSRTVLSGVSIGYMFG